MATATKVTKGFATHCPMCGEVDSLKIQASDVNSLSCGSCDQDFDHDDIRTIIGQWQRLLAWLDTAPAYQG